MGNTEPRDAYTGWYFDTPCTACVNGVAIPAWKNYDDFRHIYYKPTKPLFGQWCVIKEGHSWINGFCSKCVDHVGDPLVGTWESLFTSSYSQCMGIVDPLPPPNEFQQTNLDAWNTALAALSVTWPVGVAPPQARIDSATGQLVIIGTYLTGSNQTLTATGTTTQPPFTVPVGLTCPQDFAINWKTSRCETTLSCTENGSYVLSGTNAEPACVLPADQAPLIQVQPVADITPLGSCLVGTVTIISSQATCGSLAGTFTPLGGGLPLSDLGSLVKIGWCVTGSGSGLALESSCSALGGVYCRGGVLTDSSTIHSHSDLVSPESLPRIMSKQQVFFDGVAT
jgi:hypothetical protein